MFCFFILTKELVFSGFRSFITYLLAVTRLLEAINVDASEGRQLLPPEDSACFLCRDGTCILPRVPPYDWRQDVWLWYLCDGVSHCPDAWDEQNCEVSVCLCFCLSVCLCLSPPPLPPPPVWFPDAGASFESIFR